MTQEQSIVILVRKTSYLVHGFGKIKSFGRWLHLWHVDDATLHVFSHDQKGWKFKTVLRFKDQSMWLLTIWTFSLHCLMAARNNFLNMLHPHEQLLQTHEQMETHCHNFLIQSHQAHNRYQRNNQQQHSPHKWTHIPKLFLTVQKH